MRKVKFGVGCNLVILVVLLMINQSLLNLQTDEVGESVELQSLSQGMVESEEESDDFSVGGYSLLSNRWWEPSASRFNVSVEDSDGDGWFNFEDPAPFNPAIPSQQVPSNCAEFRPVC